MTMTTTISRAAFRAWLAATPERAFRPVVDPAGGNFLRWSFGCPVAAYLFDTYGEPYGVNTKDYYRVSDSKLIPAAPWQRQFVRRYDARVGRTGTAADAIQILDGVPNESVFGPQHEGQHWRNILRRLGFRGAGPRSG